MSSICLILIRRSAVYKGPVSCAWTRCLSHSPQCYKDDKNKPYQHPKRTKNLILQKISSYVNTAERALERKAPKVYKGYRYFKDGVEDLVKDTKEYYKVSSEIRSGKPLHNFTYHQLVIYRQMPDELVRAIPLLILAVIPFGIYFFAIIALFPKTFLTSHFLTPEMMQSILRDRYKRRRQNYAPLFKQITHILKDGKTLNAENKAVLGNIINKINDRGVPEINEILQARKTFQLDKLSLEGLSYKHKNLLALCWDDRPSSLRSEALLLHHTDLAMDREGIQHLNNQALERACFRRGMDPVDQSRQKQIQYLQKWMSLSKNLKGDDLSLLLHAAILLNHSSPPAK